MDPDNGGIQLGFCYIQLANGHRSVVVTDLAVFYPGRAVGPVDLIA